MMARVASSTRVGPTFFMAGWWAGANMKPMPASFTQRPTSSGLRSILTPRAARTSAAPDREDRARLPCLATGIPAPATMNNAQNETLTEPEPSPPVPTISTASAGASTRNILARITLTAPVISSTVSPRTRSAITSAPICDGVASPDIMLSNALAASSRDKVAPVATLPMIDLRSSIACFQPCLLLVVAADHLREGRLIDRGADILFEPRDILRTLLLVERAPQRVLQLLGIFRRHVHHRHGDVGDAEDDPLAAASGFGMADTVLGRAERGRDHARGHAWQCGIASEARRGLDGQAKRRRLFRELAALVQLLYQLGRLRPQPCRDLVLAPAGCDLVLDLVEGAIARGRDAENLVPDVAAPIRNRLIVYADIAIDGLRNHVETERNVRCRLTIWFAA